MTPSLIETVARAIYLLDPISDGTAIVPWCTPKGDEVAAADAGWHRIVCDQARAALRAIEASGHTIVPVEPTREMLAEFEGADVSDWTDIRSGYQGMLSARPRVT